MSYSLLRSRPSRRANEAVKGALSDAERANMIAAATANLAEPFNILHIDYRNDHNTRDTPLRAARMYVNEMMCGRFCSLPVLTEFDNVGLFNQLIMIGPIEVRSTCTPSNADVW